MARGRKGKKTVGLIGYGSQGRAIALNLRDSGFNVAIGLKPGSGSRRRAKAEGFTAIGSVSDIAASSDIICFSFPDHLHGSVFGEQVRPQLEAGCTLWFLHGLSVHFGLVTPPPDSDVILIAPHAPGTAVREKYLGARDVSAFIAVHQDPSGRARADAVRLASAIGVARKRLVETTFEHEAIGDIFGEQAVLCGGLAALIKTGFDTLVANGHNPEHAYLEVAYQLDLIVQLVKQFGIAGMFERISVAAQYGSLVTGPKIIDATAQRRMQKIYDAVRSGKFVRKLASLDEAEVRALKESLRILSTEALDQAARKFNR